MDFDPTTATLVGFDPATAKPESAFDPSTAVLSQATPVANFANVDHGDTTTAPTPGALARVTSFLNEPADVGGIMTGAGHAIERAGLRTERGLLQAAAGIPELLPWMPDAAKRAVQDPAFSESDKLAAMEKAIPAAQNARQRAGEAIGGLGAGFATLGVGEAGATGQDVLNEGGTLGQAEGAAALAGGASEAGLAVGQLGGSIPVRMASQGAAMGAVGEAERRVDNTILPDTMHQDFSLPGLALNVGTGMAFGLFPHASESGRDQAGRLSAEVAGTKAGIDPDTGVPLPPPATDIGPLPVSPEIRADTIAAHKAAETPPHVAAAAAAGDPIAQGTQAAGDIIAEAKAGVAVTQPVPDLTPQATSVAPEAPAPVTTPPIAIPDAPAKPFHDMSFDELSAQRASAITVGRNIEDQVLGDQAPAWRAAQRAQGSMDNARADAAAQTITDIESKLPPEHRDALYGIGLPAHAFDEVQDFQGAHSDAQVADPHEAATVLGRNLTKLSNTQGTDPTAWTREQQVAYATIRGVRDRISEEGWDSKSIQSNAIRSAASQFSDPADAEFMLGRFLKPAPAAPPPIPAPQKTLPAPVTAPPVTAEPFSNGTRVLFRGDVDQIKQQLSAAGLPEGMVKLEGGNPIGVYYPSSYAGEVAKVLGVESPVQPTGDNVPHETSGYAQSVEPIGNGSKVLFRGDVDAMRQRLTDAGIDLGYARVEDGAKVGVYFPKAVADKVAAVLKAPEPVADVPNVQTDATKGQTPAPNADTSLQAGGNVPAREAGKVAGVERPAQEPPKAAPEAPAPSEGPKPVSTKEASMQAARVARGEEALPKVPMPAHEQEVADARQRMADNPHLADGIVARKLGGDHTISAADEAVLQAHAVDLTNQMEAQAKHASDPNAGQAERDLARQKGDELAQRFNDLNQATKITGAAWSHFGRQRMQELLNDFSFAALVRKETTRQQRPLTADETATIKQQADTIAKLEKEAETHAQALKDALADKAKPSGPKKSLDERAQARLRVDIANLEQQIRQRLSACPV